MSRVATPTPAAVSRSCVLEAADWKTYTRLLRVFADRRGVRLTYDRGRLEIMSPRLEHDDESRLLGLFVFVLAEELKKPLHPGGTVTMRRQLHERGIEADECFWIENAPRMRGRRRLNLRIDPPPDLAIEVDVTHSSLDRLDIYAALRVPEIWRLDGDVLKFFVLGNDGLYADAARSRSFPMVTPADLLRFLRKARRAGDDIPVLRSFRAWVRKHGKTGGQ